MGVVSPGTTVCDMSAGVTSTHVVVQAEQHESCRSTPTLTLTLTATSPLY